MDEFEKWLYKEDSDVNPEGLTCEEINIMQVAWQAAQQQSAGEIAELKADNERLLKIIEIYKERLD